MFVRTMYITADPAKVGPALDVLAKETPGMLAEQEGYRGLGIFADRAAGKIVTGSWWESEQAMRDSDALMSDRRKEMLTPLVSTIAVMGMEAVSYTRPASSTSGGFRLQRMVFDPHMADTITQVFEQTGLARFKEIAGFAGASLLMDKARGLGSVGVVYRDMAALEASRGEQAAIREEAYKRLGGMQLIALEEFEVVDLEVPTQ